MSDDAKALLDRMQELADDWQQQAAEITDAAMDIPEDDPMRQEREIEAQGLRLSVRELRRELKKWQEANR